MLLFLPWFWFRLPLGSMRFREKGSSGGHKGLAGIEAESRWKNGGKMVEIVSRCLAVSREEWWLISDLTSAYWLPASASVRRIGAPVVKHSSNIREQRQATFGKQNYHRLRLGARPCSVVDQRSEFLHILQMSSCFRMYMQTYVDKVVPHFATRSAGNILAQPLTSFNASVAGIGGKNLKDWANSWERPVKSGPYFFCKAKKI